MGRILLASPSDSTVASTYIPLQKISSSFYKTQASGTTQFVKLEENSSTELNLPIWEAACTSGYFTEVGRVECSVGCTEICKVEDI